MSKAARQAVINEHRTARVVAFIRRGFLSTAGRGRREARS